MCNRFNITDSLLMQELLKTLEIDIGPLPKPRYSIAPIDRVPVIHELDGKRALTQMRWWLVAGGWCLVGRMVQARNM